MTSLSRRHSRWGALPRCGAAAVPRNDASSHERETAPAEQRRWDVGRPATRRRAPGLVAKRRRSNLRTQPYRRRLSKNPLQRCKLRLHPSCLRSNRDREHRESSRAGVERVGLWFLEDNNRRLVCKELFTRANRQHTSGVVLHSREFPTYLRALEERRAIVADTARTHPLTRELSEAYLIPHAIGSLLGAWSAWFATSAMAAPGLERA